jgi:hypothetical protein
VYTPRIVSPRSRTDRAASFNAVACCSEVAEPDAFTKSWGGTGVDNWIFPPFSRVAQAIRHLEHSNGVGTVLVPLYSNTVWWPLVREGAKGMVQHVVVSKMHPVPLQHGGRDGVPMKPQYPLLAVRMDFSR